MTENTVKNNGLARPPVVVILGHVDHGKTKILDFIRKTKVAEGEAGGITQHIGAYQVTLGADDKLLTSDIALPSLRTGSKEGPKGTGDSRSMRSGATSAPGRKITFLDTPGHEAFSAIRSRGAKVADIAVLVVAADESVKPQTVEAIKIIEETKTSFIVAINKIDKENANPLKVKQDLAEKNVLVEDWGGKVPVVEVSAKTGQGIDALLEMILLVAEVEEENISKSRNIDPSFKASAVVIESHMDKQRGFVATLLVQSGFFQVNDWVVAGSKTAKIKSMEDFLGKSVEQAGPSQPVVVLGWQDAPVVGEKVFWAGSREEAGALAQKQAKLGPSNLFVQEAGPKKDSGKILNLIVKSDVFSSLEAIDQVLKTIKSEEVGCRVVDFGVGDISEGDVKKAVAMKALVVGFHVETSPSVNQLAEREGVVVEIFQIIYELVESVKNKMSDLLDPEINRISLGRLKVLALFKKEVKSQVVGGKVVSGKIKRGAMVDVLRNGKEAVATGRLSQLQQQKADVEEVVEGLEAGIRFDFGPVKNITPNMYIREGDVLEVYEEEKIKRSL